MEVLLLILAFILLISGIINLYSKFTSKRKSKKREDLLETLPKFEIPLDSFKLNGTYWQESVPVDINNNELDTNDPYFYGRGGFGVFTSSIDKYHKQKNKTKFSTKLYIKISYLGTQYKYITNFPMEDTNIRIKFYLKKTIDVYVENSEIYKNGKKIKAIRFLLDFRFLEHKGISIVSTNFY